MAPNSAAVDGFGRPISDCRHEESLWGRCTRCGRTWGQQAHDPDSWDRNGAVDGSGHVHSDADPGL